MDSASKNHGTNGTTSHMGEKKNLKTLVLVCKDSQERSSRIFF